MAIAKQVSSAVGAAWWRYTRRFLVLVAVFAIIRDPQMPVDVFAWWWKHIVSVVRWIVGNFRDPAPAGPSPTTVAP